MATKLTSKQKLIKAIIKLMQEEEAKTENPDESLISFATKLGTAIDDYAMNKTSSDIEIIRMYNELEYTIRLKENKIEKGAPDGYTPLDINSKVPSTYLQIIDNLLTGGSESLLSAEQGKILQEQIDIINSTLSLLESDKNIIYSQPVPTAVWYITHNMGKFPAVTIMDNYGEEYESEIIHINNNQLEIRFSVIFSGYATLN